MTEGRTAVNVALTATTLAAVALILLAVLDAAWLGWVAIGLLAIAAVAGEIWVWGVRGALWLAALLLVVGAFAYAVEKL